MRLLPLLLLLLVSRLAGAQPPVSLTGKVTDKVTGAALPYAAVQLVGTSLGTTTNQAGEFVFRLPAATPGQPVTFSYVGYQSVTIAWPNSGQPPLTIALQPDAVRLQEVVVRPLNPLDLIARSLEKAGQNYAAAPYQAEGFQREVVTADRRVIQLLEVAYRTVGSVRAHTTTVLDGRYLEDKQAKAPLWNPARGGFYTFGWTAISGIDAPNPHLFLGLKLKKVRDLARYYTFALRQPMTLDGKEVYVIDFDQKPQVRQPLLKGTLYLDAASEALVKLEHQVSPHGLPFLQPHHTWGGQTISQAPKRLTVQQDRWTTTYRPFGPKWYLRSVVIDTDFSAALVFLGQELGPKASLHLHSERIVTVLDTTRAAGAGTAGAAMADVGTLPTLQNFIRKEYEGRETTWATANYLLPDTALAGVAQQLRRQNEQWEAAQRKRTAERYLACQAYSARQLREDVAYLRESLEKLHPGLYWHTDKPRLDRAFAQLERQLPKTAAETEFYQQLRPLIEQIHCGHTVLYPSQATEDYQQLFGKHFPLDLWLTDEGAVVSQDYAGIPRGATVLAINGHELPDLLRRWRAGLPADGQNQTYKSFCLQQDFPALLAGYWPATDTFAVHLQDPNGTRWTVRLAGVERAAGPDRPATARVHEALRTLVLTVPSFDPRQDFPAFLAETFRTLAAQPLTSLIIDLRGNQGGRDDYAALLYAYLAEQPFRFYNHIAVTTNDRTLLNRLSVGGVPLFTAVPTYLANLRPAAAGAYTLPHPGLQLQPPQPNAYKGSVYVLINGGTFSAAADFAAIVRSHQRGIFLGEEAGGGYYGNSSMGTPLLTLPHSKLRLAIPLGRYESAVCAAGGTVGHGVVPEHPVRYQVADLLANRDKELAACFDLIRNGKK